MGWIYIFFFLVASNVFLCFFFLVDQSPHTHKTSNLSPPQNPSLETCALDHLYPRFFFFFSFLFYSIPFLFHFIFIFFPFLFLFPFLFFSNMKYLRTSISHGYFISLPIYLEYRQFCVLETHSNQLSSMVNSNVRLDRKPRASKFHWWKNFPSPNGGACFRCNSNKSNIGG